MGATVSEGGSLPESKAEAEQEQGRNVLTSLSSHLLISTGQTQPEARWPREKSRETVDAVPRGQPPRAQNRAEKGRQWIGWGRSV